MFFFQAEDGIRDDLVTGVQTCAFRSGLTRPRNAAQIPPSGFGRCAWSGITRGPSLHFDKLSNGFCSGNSLVVLFVDLPFCNTVVLGSDVRRARALPCGNNEVAEVICLEPGTSDDRRSPSSA